MLSARVTGKKYNPDNFHIAKFHTILYLYVVVLVGVYG